MQLTLVDRLAPVYVEGLADNGSHLVDVGTIERHHTYANDIGHIAKGMVFCTFQLQLACQGVFGFYAKLHRRYVQVLRLQCMTQRLVGQLRQTLVNS